jgi:D-glycero-D-manno-heptose 1,7-bisphosphate phosphatase
MAQPEPAAPRRSRYVALDRDGTIIVDRHRPLDRPDDVELIEGAVDGLRTLSELGLGLVLITNQSGIGRGTMDRQSLISVHNHLLDILESHGVIFDGIYVCPHAPWEDCECRKPKPGLLNMAADDLNVRPDSFIVIGDKASDIDCGKIAGATTLLVRTGYGAQVEQDGFGGADYIADNLEKAAQVIENFSGINQHD